MQEKLLVIRKREKLSQKDVAMKVGISVKQYGEKERGETCFTSDEMFEIGEIFAMPIGEIFLPRKHQNGYKNHG